VERPDKAVLVPTGVLEDVADELVWLSEAAPVPVPLVKLVVWFPEVVAALVPLPELEV
jgi:hypothetical protein